MSSTFLQSSSLHRMPTFHDTDRSETQSIAKLSPTTRNSFMRLVPGKQYLKGKMLHFLIQKRDRQYWIALNFESPRTDFITKITGISLSDCTQKDIKEFKVKGIREEVINLRYQHHLQKVEDCLFKIYFNRKKLCMKFIQ
jgi:hypothetical protein